MDYWICRCVSEEIRFSLTQQVERSVIHGDIFFINTAEETAAMEHDYITKNAAKQGNAHINDIPSMYFRL